MQEKEEAQQHNHVIFKWGIPGHFDFTIRAIDQDEQFYHTNLSVYLACTSTEP